MKKQYEIKIICKKCKQQTQIYRYSTLQIICQYCSTAIGHSTGGSYKYEQF